MRDPVAGRIASGHPALPPILPDAAEAPEAAPAGPDAGPPDCRLPTADCPPATDRTPGHLDLTAFTAAADAADLTAEARAALVAMLAEHVATRGHAAGFLVFGPLPTFIRRLMAGGFVLSRPNGLVLTAKAIGMIGVGR